MTYTDDNLKKAFAGESQANRRYLAFAKKAEGDGLKQVAKLFRAVAAAETVHANLHLDKMGEVKDTEENIRQAIKGETYEATEMYPSMITHAREDSNTEAETIFRWADKVEGEHAELFKEALEKMKDLPESDYYICQGCGHTHVSEAPEFCPVCGASRDSFIKAE